MPVPLRAVEWSQVKLHSQQCLTSVPVSQWSERYSLHIMVQAQHFSLDFMGAKPSSASLKFIRQGRSAIALRRDLGQISVAVPLWGSSEEPTHFMWGVHVSECSSIQKHALHTKNLHIRKEASFFFFNRGTFYPVSPSLRAT